jgi:hypothetical protein
MACPFLSAAATGAVAAPGLLEQWLNGLSAIYQDLIITIDAGIPKSGGT